MLYFLTGTDNARKKEYIFRALAENAEKRRRTWLIVPEQSSFERDREFLFRYGEVTGNRITVTGITQLARTIMEDNGLKVKPDADEAARNVLMSLAVEEAGDSLELYARHKGRPGTVAELLREYTEIRQAGFVPEDLSRVSLTLPEGTLRTKTDELGRIFSAYESLVTSRFSEKTDNLGVVSEYLLTHDHFSGSEIWFYDYRGFTGMQLRLIRQMLRQAENVYVAVNAPSSVSVPDSEAFDHALRTARELRRAAAMENITSSEICTDGEPDGSGIGFLRSRLFSFSDAAFERETDRITVIAAENKYAECEYAALEIRRLLREENYRCREIAVVERGGAYAAPMNAALKKYGIPVFTDRRIPLGDYPLIRACVGAVKLAVYGFTAEGVLSLIKTGVIGISDEECTLLENYIAVWQTDRRGWTKDFTGNPDGFGEELTDDRRKRLAVINSIRQTVVAPILKLKKELEKNSGEASCAAVFEYLQTVGAAEHFRDYAEALYARGSTDEALRCAEVWDAVTMALDALHGALAGRTVVPSRFAELFGIMLSAGDVGGIPAGTDEIVTGSADRTRFSGIRAVFVLGANEGVFPRKAETGGLFSAKERKQLEQANLTLENLPENIYAEERYIAYLTLTAPAQRLYVSYSRGSIAGETLRPSEIVSELRRLIPKHRSVDTGTLTAADKAASPEAAFEQYASVYGEGTDEEATLRKYLSGTGYAGRLGALDRAAKKTPESFTDPAAATELFGMHSYVSPSKAESYRKCPFMYFCRYGMGAEKLRPAGLDARINGLLVHHVLEIMLGEIEKAELTALSPEEVRRKIVDVSEAYITECMGGREDKSVSFNRSLDKVEEECFEILMRLISEFGQSRFVTKDVELKIGYGGEIEPYRIDLPDGGSITVGGTVDRVDVMEEDGKAYLRVIDYKTGGKEFRLSDVFDGLNMQMLIYLMCLWSNGGERYGDVVPAGILYVPAKTGGSRLGRREGADAVLKNKLENGRMNGLLLDDLEVIKGMDSSAEGKYINVKIGKDGKLEGKFLSLTDFAKLHKKIDEMLADTAMRLHAGEIAALPVLDYHYGDACRYCDYNDVCLRESSDEYRTLLSLRHEAAVKKLEEEVPDDGTELD